MIDQAPKELPRSANNTEANPHPPAPPVKYNPGPNIGGSPVGCELP